MICYLPIWVVVVVTVIVVKCSAKWNLFTVIYKLTSTQTQTETPITTPTRTPITSSTQTPTQTPFKPPITPESLVRDEMHPRRMQRNVTSAHHQVPNGQQYGFGFGNQRSSCDSPGLTPAGGPNGELEPTPYPVSRILLPNFPTQSVNSGQASAKQPVNSCQASAEQPVNSRHASAEQPVNSPPASAEQSVNIRQASAEQLVNSPPAPGNGSVEVQVKQEQHKRNWSEISHDEIDNMDLIQLKKTCAKYEVPVKRNYNSNQLRNALKKQKLASEN